MTPTASFKAQSNRRNAERSTGPRTEQGKCRSRFNALTHGITARFTVLPNENASAYQYRLDGFMTHLKPKDAFEHYLVERAVKESWISERATRAHTAHLAKYMTEAMAEALEKAGPDSPYLDVISNPALYTFDPSDLGERYRQYELKCDWAFLRTLNLLFKVKRGAASDESAPLSRYSYLARARSESTTPPSVVTAPAPVATGRTAEQRESGISENEAKSIFTDYTSKDDCAHSEVPVGPAEPPASLSEVVPPPSSALIPCATGPVNSQASRADVARETRILENEAKLMCTGYTQAAENADRDGVTAPMSEAPQSAGAALIEPRLSIDLRSPGAIRFDLPGALPWPRSGSGKSGSRRQRRREAARRK
jgi:hypothetical protein